MKNKSKKTSLFVEASALVEDHVSGVGLNTVSLIRKLGQDSEAIAKYKIILLVPHGSQGMLERWKFPPSVSFKFVLLEKHILQVLLKYRLLPPMDLIIGKGLYIFPNYKNWPLLFSKSVTFIYDVAFLMYPETVQPKNLKMLQDNVATWAKRTDMVITVSNNSRQEIIKYLKLSPSKVGVVYCGVDNSLYYRSQEKDIIAVKQKYQIEGKYILFVGNIEPRKNLMSLLEAYKLLPDSITSNFSLLIVGGDGWLSEGIFEKIATLRKDGYKIIRPNKFVENEDMSAIYSGASILVLPSIHEGFGMPIIEAMAAETPVAISHIPAMVEVADKAAVYFDPYKPESIADTISNTITNNMLRKNLIAAGNKRVGFFSWDKSESQLVGYINQVAGSDN